MAIQSPRDCSHDSRQSWKIATGGWRARRVFAVMHGIGYFACLREPRIFDLWITKVSKCPRVKNYNKWGCNSYAA